MKVTSKHVVHVTLQAAILAVALCASAKAEDADTTAVSDRALQAKIEYCKTCHGLSGQGFRGASVMPRLAGQQAEYIENQLTAFAERRRQNRFMNNVARVLGPEMRKGLAAHFSKLSATSPGGAPSGQIAEGKAIYENGVPDANVPACITCHGPGAKGNLVFPRLAGQLHDYVTDKLANWTKERGLKPSEADLSAVMQPVARGLTRSQMSAVAAYVSSLD